MWDRRLSRRVLAWLGAVAALALAAAATGAVVAVGEDLSIAGQPTPDELEAFAGEGGRHVIDLRTADEDRGYDEPAAVQATGMQYHNLPIAGTAGLTRENVGRLDELLAATAGAGEPTLLHCASANRVGALMALRARWVQGAGVAEALEVGRRHGLASLEPQVEALLHEAP